IKAAGRKPSRTYGKVPHHAPWRTGRGTTGDPQQSREIAGPSPFTAGSKIATHSTCEVIGKMSAWTQAGKPQVRDACGSRMRAAGRPERQMSVTALHRFGADNLARHAYLRSASPGTEPHVGGVTSVRPVRTRGSPLKGQCDRNSLTRPLRAWEACPACCTPPGDGATYFDHPGHEHAVWCLS